MVKTTQKEKMQNLIKLVPEYGRWSEVVYLLNSANEKLKADVAEFLYDQFVLDEQNMVKGNSVSLLAKWLPSENTSSKETVQKARLLMSYWDMAPKQYRKRVSALRKHIGILEQKMSSGDWEIDYSKLPSQAHRKHVKAFAKHDEVGYREYLESVQKGEKKINAGTLFTYEIYDELFKSWNPDQSVLNAMDAMWKALPDYTNGSNAIVIADVSGSMSGRPMSVSTSLALYFAERNKGTFHNFFMTFSANPRLVQVQGANIYEKMRNIMAGEWGMNTNVDAAFDEILRAAINGKCTQEELPSTLYIISDMQFDSCVRAESNFERAERKFKEAGYELPHVVFWNVRASEAFPATKFDDKVTLISGSNQSTFQYVVEGKTPLECMNDVLNGERYAQIVL